MTIRALPMKRFTSFGLESRAIYHTWVKQRSREICCQFIFLHNLIANFSQKSQDIVSGPKAVPRYGINAWTHSIQINLNKELGEIFLLTPPKRRRTIRHHSIDAFENNDMQEFLKVTLKVYFSFLYRRPDED